MQGKLTATLLALTLALVLVPSASASFGIAAFDGLVTNQDGTPDTQAGSHPYAITTKIMFNTTIDPSSQLEVSEGNVKDISVDLPAGFVGNPEAVPTCTEDQLQNAGSFAANCPIASQVGVTTIYTDTFETRTLPIYNMRRPSGTPAEFAFNVLGFSMVHMFASVRSGGDYGLRVDVRDISQSLSLKGTSLTFWGVPADPSHDPERYNPALYGFGASTDQPLTPFLTNPTDCAAGPMTTTLSVDSWQSPDELHSASYVSHDNATPAGPLGLDGCDRLAFKPSISVRPDTAQADTPAGLTVEVRVPEDGLMNTSGLSSADIRDTTVTLPAGLAINPGQAAGLVACPISQDGVGGEGAPSCPLASKVGTAEISTPLLADKLEGNIYILPSNPPHLQLLVAASADGVNLKLVGDVRLDEQTGQLTTTFANTPALPFTDLKLSFSGGAQAALATPPLCGTYTTVADFTPWSAPEGSDELTEDSFGIASGAGGSPCAERLPFSPSLTAGATTDQAGGFTSFSLLLQRGDGQERVSSLQFKTPEGLLGMISKVPVCADSQAAAGACPTGSQIGHTVLQAGPGPFPLVIPQPGAPAAPIYLTGPYKGAPYGLEIAVPVLAGPFDLGTVVVRASIAVDRRTSQLTITTDPLPAILDGVPTDLRTINAVIDRPGFMFNPTSCAPMAFGGTATGTEGTVAPISTHFQVGSCQSLKFAPKFAVSTSGKTSRKDGASLDAKIVYPTGPVVDNQASQQANIAKVKVDLPKQLPSRLTTLQKACLAATFEVNPGNCPAASVVGSGKAVTPVLGVPLSGPAYFVSHGGEAFPSLVVVLQGAGVRVDLTGSTFISKQGITSSTFKQVPDVPISSFELILPKGPHSALAANGNLCTSKLAMPTAFVGQNGAEIHQSTKLTATGCSKQKPGAKRKPNSKQKHKPSKAEGRK
jgi:hypothetical protein